MFIVLHTGLHLQTSLNESEMIRKAEDLYSTLVEHTWCKEDWHFE